ncbi:hypothetical protein ACIOML_22735 [Streptomyces anulatus]
MPEGQDPFAVIVGSMLAAGIGREGFVGAAGSHLFDAGPAVEFGVRWIEEHLNRAL